MAVTENTYTGNGSTTSYSLTFQYIDEDDIKVSLNGTDTTAYTLANATTVLFNTAPANGVAIRIYRRTNTDNLKATFFAGSAIRAQDLNDDFLQNNYAVQEIQNNTWDKETQTIHSDEAWVSSDTQIATTAAMDARFQDEAAETITSAEGWPDNDDTIATTAAIDNRIDSKIDAAITGDIATDGTGITVTNDGDGTITLGLGANSIDFDRIKDVDIITQAEQNAGSPSPADTNLFTASAAARRFDTIVQTTTPTGSNWEVGKTWLQNDANLTLSVWNGSAWLGLASGGTFTNQPKVVYVDASAGSDNNDGHRISRPKATIKAAIQQINNDASYGDGSIVVVAPGVYQEVAPIDIQKSNVSIIGTALRSCIVHPTPATETNVLFRVNSGSYLQNLTFTGMKASGALGNTVDAALPVNQGWNVAFYPGATIIKSPYIQNCTNFSDSEIDNSNLNVITPAGGAAGDTDSAPTGGGLLVDGSVVSSSSPLRSMVCDSYTHVGLNGPGILVTNNGYAQCTSSYAFFNKYHIKCLNGGQANLAASTTDFGDQALVADGKSTAAIFTAALSTSASSGATTFTINAPTAGASWHGSATRPQGNMLVVLNGITYPILSAVANGSGWDVTISRPNPTNRSENLGLNGAVNTPATASFYLRSMIASSGHTMEYVGSGTNYSALPENGGVPDNTKQIVELNNGKVWTAITDQNGKFKVGDFFEVDQQLGFVTIPSGSIAFDLASDLSPQLGANLDVLSRTISSSTGNVRIDDALEVNAGTAAAPAVTFNGDTNTGIYSPGADQVAISTGGSGRLFVDSSGRVGVASAPDSWGTLRPIQNGEAAFSVNPGNNTAYLTCNGYLASGSGLWTKQLTGASSRFDLSGDNHIFYTSASGSAGSTFSWSERMRLTPTGLGVGTNSPAQTLHVDASGGGIIRVSRISASAGAYGQLEHDGTNTTVSSTANLLFFANGAERARIDSSGRLGIGTSSPGQNITVQSSASGTAPTLKLQNPVDSNSSVGAANGLSAGQLLFGATGAFPLTAKIESRYDSSASFGRAAKLVISSADYAGGLTDAVTVVGGSVGIGTTSPDAPLEVVSAGGNGVVNDCIRLHYPASFGSSSSGNSLLFTALNGSNAKVTYSSIAGLIYGNTAGSHSGILRFSTASGGANTERMRIDESGRVLVGTSTARSNFFNAASYTPQIQLEGAGAAGQTMFAITSGDASLPSYLILSRQKSGAVGGNTAVSNNDTLGNIAFQGSDGSEFVAGAYITAEVDGTPGANDLPTRLVFSTTADGASSPTEAMRITSARQIIHSCAASGEWSIRTKNLGNSSLYYGISIQCGTDAATGTNYAAEFTDGDGTNQGYITFTGGTVTYGAFTAHHPCILPEADNEAGYPYGTLLEIINIEYTQKDGKDTERGILYNVRKTQAANSRAVLGAYGSSMNGGPSGETNRHQALVLGDGHILCNNSGGNIKVGDGICSSATPGIGQKATATPSMIIGIAQEDVTFADDDEVKLVAVQYGVRQFIPWGD